MFILSNDETPFMSRASVIIKPLKFSSFFNIVSIIFLDKDEGRNFSFSRAGTSK